ncbi:MAG: hypothetical protein AB1815_10175 [Bacillota bacterium]
MCEKVVCPLVFYGPVEHLFHRAGILWYNEMVNYRYDREFWHGSGIMFVTTQKSGVRSQESE